MQFGGQVVSLKYRSCVDMSPYTVHDNYELCIMNYVLRIMNYASEAISGGYCGRVPPLPIPNREVKPACADGTAMQCGRVGSRLLFKSEALIQQYESGLLFACFLFTSTPTSFHGDAIEHHVSTVCVFKAHLFHCQPQVYLRAVVL